MTITVYREPATGREPYTEWLNSIRDTTTRARIAARVDRLNDGNFGDHSGIIGGEGLCELRMHFGAGFRVYYAVEKFEIVVLFGGGDKSSQEDDIRKCIQRLHEHRSRRGTSYD